MTQSRELDGLGDLVVRTLSYESAEQFMKALHPLAGWTPRFSSWIFRGHGNANWKLLPSAHRPNALTAYGGPCEAPQVQLREGLMLRRFFKAADRAGVNIPGNDGDSFASAIEMRAENYNWPHSRAVPLLALAQHHGLPTRLLDWTRSGQIAAYFAAQPGKP